MLFESALKPNSRYKIFISMQTFSSEAAELRLGKGIPVPFVNTDFRYLLRSSHLEGF